VANTEQLASWASTGAEHTQMSTQLGLALVLVLAGHGSGLGRNLMEGAGLCDDLAMGSQAAMVDCCPGAVDSGPVSGHRRTQVSCDLPGSCPSAQCAESFARFLSECGEDLRDEWGVESPDFMAFEAFFGDCQVRFGSSLEPQLIEPSDPNLQFVGRFLFERPPPPTPEPLGPLPPFAVLPGCSGSYRVITGLSECEAAKAVLEPSLAGVQNGGFGVKWSNGCFFNGGTVYFDNYGADHSTYTGWSSSHRALCAFLDPGPAPAPEPEPAAEFKVMAGCDRGYQPITNLAVCEAAKAELVPEYTGIQEGGFGAEWSNGCFFNGDRVYFHTVGAEHSTYSAWNAQHKALCVIAGPEPAPEPEPLPQFTVMSGCNSGYAPILDLRRCTDAKAALEPGLGGVQNGGFGDEWAVGCFFNGGTVYFGTTGFAGAHSDPQSYRAAGGWSGSHQALCEWTGEDNAPPAPAGICGSGTVQDVCGVCNGDGTTCIPFEGVSGPDFDMPGTEIRMRLVLDVPSVVSVLLAQRNAGTPTQSFVVWIDGNLQGPGYHNASFTTATALDDRVYPYPCPRRPGAVKHP
jgi:hypothetical protein